MPFKTASLTPSQQEIILSQGTECPFSGHYPIEKSSTAVCRQCGLALFRTDHQFDSGTGWPSFDQSIAGHVLEIPDPDGLRTEIRCQRCQGHLGHVFRGEGMTELSTRFCVNTLSMEWVHDDALIDTEEIILAGGCFWGVQSFFAEQPGVLKTEVGYSGGTLDNPNYQQVCSHSSGHFECVRVLFDPEKTNLTNLLKSFFNLIDPTQANGQGPDIGPPYQSAVFYFNPEQKQQTQALIKQLEDKGMVVATKTLPIQTFWPAEDYHQDYFKKNNAPSCHHTTERFD